MERKIKKKEKRNQKKTIKLSLARRIPNQVPATTPDFKQGLSLIIKGGLIITVEPFSQSRRAAVHKHKSGIQ